jgi:DNA polymerase-3 subunit gamma/tau
MKWAPNKRLHFEVAVIKAIQTLNQVTLNEVIENLAALRDGKPVAVAGIADPGPRQSKPRPVEKVAEVPKAAAVQRPAQVQQLAEVPKAAGVTDPGYKAEETPPIDPSETWRKTVEKVRTTRRLIAGWVEAGTALGMDGRFFTVGFPPEQKAVVESLSIPKTREYVEGVLKEISGQDLKIKFVVKEGLAVVAPAETAPAPAPKKESSSATFKDDPLIREALEIFKGEIKTVTD